MTDARLAAAVAASTMAATQAAENTLDARLAAGAVGYSAGPAQSAGLAFAPAAKMSGNEPAPGGIGRCTRESHWPGALPWKDKPSSTEFASSAVLQPGVIPPSYGLPLGWCWQVREPARETWRPQESRGAGTNCRPRRSSRCCQPV
jgi:hypothetical protein